MTDNGKEYIDRLREYLSFSRDYREAWTILRNAVIDGELTEVNLITYLRGDYMICNTLTGSTEEMLLYLRKMEEKI